MDTASRDPRREAAWRQFQLYSLLVMNVGFFVSWGLIFLLGYSGRRPTLPLGFLISVAIIGLVAGLAQNPQYARQLLNWTPEEGAIPPVLALKVAVIGLTVASFLPPSWLVLDTGGVRESPFVPLMTAPALFSPAVAIESISALGAAVAGMVAFSVVTVFDSARHPGVHYSASAWDYAVVATVLMTVGAFISHRQRDGAARSHPPVRVTDGVPKQEDETSAMPEPRPAPSEGAA